MEFLRLLRRDVVAAAPRLLGWHLVLGEMRARIVEVEAYRTPDDPGCHAHHGRSPKCESMFHTAGLAYVYFTYGNHWMLNVVAHDVGDAAAILIRAAEPLEGLDQMRMQRPRARRDEDLLSGPGKLTAAFGIDRRFDRTSLLEGELRIEYGDPPAKILIGTRVGLAQGKGDDLPWRFVDAGALRWVSRPHLRG